MCTKIAPVQFDDFYPRSPCGERLVGDVWACRWPDISIHALLAESDVHVYELVWGVSISIHALLAESDMNWLRTAGVEDDISIHALLAESDSKSAQNSGALLRI